VNVHELDEEVLHAVFLELDLQRAAVHIDLLTRSVRPDGNWLGATPRLCIIAGSFGLK
jgi:hypothetical protein